jgi:hypothetical protein
MHGIFSQNILFKRVIMSSVAPIPNCANLTFSNHLEQPSAHLTDQELKKTIHDLEIELNTCQNNLCQFRLNRLNAWSEKETDFDITSCIASLTSLSKDELLCQAAKANVLQNQKNEYLNCLSKCFIEATQLLEEKRALLKILVESPLMDLVNKYKGNLASCNRILEEKKAQHRQLTVEIDQLSNKLRKDIGDKVKNKERKESKQRERAILSDDIDKLAKEIRVLESELPQFEINLNLIQRKDQDALQSCLKRISDNETQLAELQKNLDSVNQKMSTILNYFIQNMAGSEMDKEINQLKSRLQELQRRQK